MKKFKVEVCVTHYYDIVVEVETEEGGEDYDLEEKAEELANIQLKQHPDAKYFDSAYEIDASVEEIEEE